MSLSSGDLTTLATAKAYLDSPPSDAVLSGLITRTSRMIQTDLNRSLLVPKTYVEQFNGYGTQQLVLPNYPLLSITSLVVSGVVMNLSPQPNDMSSPTTQYGYRFQPWNGLPPGDPADVELVGARYWTGNQNVVVTYKAGYQVTDESGTIPTSTPFTILPSAPYGSWATDEGVVYSSSGVSLTAITSGTPNQGQYLPPNPGLSTPRTTYAFNSTDAGLGVLLSYGYVPADLEQVTLEVIAERAAYRLRPGLRSKSLAAQETMSYDTSGLSDWAKLALRPYRSVLPSATGGSV